MQPPVFYAPPENIDEDTILLPSDEARHVSKVMRLKVGELVIIVDGQGMAYRSELVNTTARKTVARIHAPIREFGEASIHLTLAAGLSAGSKFDAVVQRGTELGVKRFVPLVTEKSKVVLDDPRRAKGRVTRLEKVALAAIKQCRRSVLPMIAMPTRLGDFIAEYDPEQTLGLVFHPGKESSNLNDALADLSGRRIALLVGPEAGLSDVETEEATEAGFLPVSLGPRILRTETAGPVATALVMAQLGELS